MNPRVLVVDDEPAARDSLARALRQFDRKIEVLEAGSADEAWRTLGEQSVDVVLLDVAMPGRSGFDLLEQMAEARLLEAIPVVLVTGAGSDALRRRALDIGAADLLNKPVERADLFARLRNVLKMKSITDSLRRHEDELELLVAQKIAEIEHSRAALVVRLAKIAELHDDSTGNHVVRVGCYAEETAREMGLDAEFRKNILLSSPLHDLGKVAIPDAILLKSGPLSDEEWQVMRTHCELGARMLQEEPSLLRKVISSRPYFPVAQEHPDAVLAMASRIAGCHHEKWDGSGYPRGLKGEKIPLEARIVAVVDAFDALTTPRRYRKAVADDVALEILMADQGRHFDADVFDAFVSCFPRIKANRRALLESERGGLEQEA
jgi:putative two-component system response regulator